MPRAHDDCKFRDEWLVQDKYKEWVVKDGDPRLARCQFCMKSSKTKFHHPVFCPGFQKGRVPSEKGTFSAVNGPSKGHN